MSKLGAGIREYMMDIVSKDNVLSDEPMNKHTTFQVGGKADTFITVDTYEQLSKIIVFLRRLEEDYFILGNGSNLLVGDKGYDGVVIRLGKDFQKIETDGNKITFGAAVLLSKAANVAAKNSLTGMEFASGIPGSIGGAVVMNAGAYGGEMNRIITSVKVMNIEGDVMTLDNASMEFGYRTSVIKNRPFVVLETQVALDTGVQIDIYAKMDEFNTRRRDKQPLEFASAGSTFKRPEGHYAGQLIMEAGLSGLRVGDAQVSEKHCGFIINCGNATATDVKNLIEIVREKVHEHFYIDLIPEVVFLGEF